MKFGTKLNRNIFNNVKIDNNDPVTNSSLIDLELFLLNLKTCFAALAVNAFPQGDFQKQQPFSQQQFAERRDGSASKTPGGYFQYVNVPAHKEYEFGWNRGNPDHFISRYEQNKDHRFRTRVSIFDFS